MRVVYMGHYAGLDPRSVLFGRRVRRGPRPQHRGGDAAGDDQRHADPARQRDGVAEQR